MYEVWCKAELNRERGGVDTFLIVLCDNSFSILLRWKNEEKTHNNNRDFDSDFILYDGSWCVPDEINKRSKGRIRGITAGNR